MNALVWLEPASARNRVSHFRACRMRQQHIERRTLVEPEEPTELAKPQHDAMRLGVEAEQLGLLTKHFAEVEAVEYAPTFAAPFARRLHHLPSSGNHLVLEEHAACRTASTGRAGTRGAGRNHRQLR